MSLPKEKNIILAPSSVGLFSKKEAASLIASGCAHLHSSIVGKRDSLVSLTHQAIDNQISATYPWEVSENTNELFLTSSKERKKTIEQVLTELKLKNTSSMGDKIWTSLEELLTNSIFHAYHDPKGKEKYYRKESVELLPEEKILIKFHRSPTGFFLSVKDSGQGLSFEKVQNNFKRCYASSDISQIETKDGGAGLGLYVVFELATHIKIISHPSFGTLTSCWFATPATFNPDYFSFNYFEGDQKL